jgi:hypothetical protein
MSEASVKRVSPSRRLRAGWTGSTSDGYEITDLGKLVERDRSASPAVGQAETQLVADPKLLLSRFTQSLTLDDIVSTYAMSESNVSATSRLDQLRVIDLLQQPIKVRVASLHGCPMGRSSDISPRRFNRISLRAGSTAKASAWHS